MAQCLAGMAWAGKIFVFIDGIKVPMAHKQRFDGSALSLISQQFLGLGEAFIWRWEREARARILGADALKRQSLISTFPALLVHLAQILTPSPLLAANGIETIASAHGAERARTTQFGPDQIAQEYQILSETISVVADGHIALIRRDWAIIDRSINLAMRQALRAFAFTQEDLRRKLAASISHDMRTPLAVVINGAQLAQRSVDAELTKRLAGKIASNADRLKEMLAELLDALTFTHGAKLALELSTFDIADLVKEICVEYQQMNATCVRTCSEAVQGTWCRKSMRRALENLVNNAVKYGDGGAVEIVAARRDERLLLSVHNAGAPIPPEQQGRIFEYFTRDVAAAASIGWGLGLPFVKRVAESHGGAVMVDSSAANGTTFLLEIPVDCRPYVQATTG